MNTEQAKQLRLAADIIETGHPWEYQPDHHKWQLSEGHCPLFAIQQRWPIRIVLATPPDGRALHNPDSLTAEQVGAGWRLTLPGEKPHGESERWSGSWKKREFADRMPCVHQDAYRVPLSVPWPEAPKPEPDPYAELKAAHAAGKEIEVHQITRNTWDDCPLPVWTAPPERYRIKPEPALQLPPPPPGMQWHRENGWQEGDLPQGWRPHYHGEGDVSGDERKYNDKWEPVNGSSDVKSNKGNLHRRTRRPLTFEHAGKTWTYHRPGDPMPCDGEREVELLGFGPRFSESGISKGSYWSWISPYFNCLGWRYADEKKTVPLGPEDVPPGSVFRPVGWSGMSNAYVNYEAVVTNGVRTIEVDWSPFCSEHGYLPWSELAEGWQINRSIPLSGKWDADAWEPCSKQI